MNTQNPKQSNTLHHFCSVEEGAYLSFPGRRVPEGSSDTPDLVAVVMTKPRSWCLLLLTLVTCAGTGSAEVKNASVQSQHSFSFQIKY